MRFMILFSSNVYFLFFETNFRSNECCHGLMAIYIRFYLWQFIEISLHITLLIREKNKNDFLQESSLPIEFKQACKSVFETYS